MKKLLLLLALIVIMGSGFCGNSLMNVMAEEPSVSQGPTLYKSIEIQKGDSLWHIAEEYAPLVGLTVPEYINCLKQMNHLGEDTIHAGYYLTVMYR